MQVDEDGVFLRSLDRADEDHSAAGVSGDRRREPRRARSSSASGHCIRNNAATNIFNKDLDSRNYGVGRYGRVFLFDYDAVEKLTEVKIRTNTDREPGEEAVPEWFFEDGVIFLPEEIDYGMQLANRYARRCFREENSDLMTVEYWEEVQQKLLRGEVPELRMYPVGSRLNHEPATS